MTGGQFTVSNRGKWFEGHHMSPSGHREHVYYAFSKLSTFLSSLLASLPRDLSPQWTPSRVRRLRSGEDGGTAGCSGSKPRLWRKTIQEKIPASLRVLGKGLHLCELPLPHLKNRDMTICLTCGSFIHSVNTC